MYEKYGIGYDTVETLHNYNSESYNGYSHNRNLKILIDIDRHFCLPKEVSDGFVGSIGSYCSHSTNKGKLDAS